MFEKRQRMREAAVFDGEAPTGMAGAPPEGEEYLKELAILRSAVEAASRQTPEISDSQFGAFMAGIQGAIAEPVPRAFHLWKSLSIAAAALVIVIALLTIFYPGAEPVKANAVESVSTELNGATVDWYDSKEGVTTVWVKTSGDDVW